MGHFILTQAVSFYSVRYFILTQAISFYSMRYFILTQAISFYSTRYFILTQTISRFVQKYEIKIPGLSRTFQGLFTFFQESFFINSPNTAYTQDFCPIQDRKRISLSSSLFLPDFSSAYCLLKLLSYLPFPISALQGFTSCCIQFVLLKSNRKEYHGRTTAEYGTTLHFLLPILQFS